MMRALQVVAGVGAPPTEARLVKGVPARLGRREA